MNDGPRRRSKVSQSAAYRMLVLTARTSPSSPAGQLWTRAWIRLTRRMTGASQIRVHGQKIQVNTGYAYPAFSRRWHMYNAPLVELVWQVRQRAGRSITMIDVGAAVGDTALLVMEQCPGAVNRVFCVEPDEEFFGYLINNLNSWPEAVLVNTMLSDTSDGAPDLIRIHSGTASAQGANTRPTKTLDDVLADEPVVDVIKIDTDGFDGRVLAGAQETLARHAPGVIFEWHPILIAETGQDPLLPFRILANAGYTWFIWFTKEGDFSHMMSGIDEAAINQMALYCQSADAPVPDWHFDVVALSGRGDRPDPAEIATLAHARRVRGI